MKSSQEPPASVIASDIALAESANGGRRMATGPGNIRELQNLIERAVIASDDGGPLSVDERWLSVASLQQPEESKTLVTHEREANETALAQTKGRVSGPLGAANTLRIPSSTLESKIKALSIDKRLFKPGPPTAGS